jgi:hypothetical protein
MKPLHENQYDISIGWNRGYWERVNNIDIDTTINKNFVYEKFFGKKTARLKNESGYPHVKENDGYFDK